MADWREHEVVNEISYPDKHRVVVNVPHDLSPLELATLVISHLVKDFGAEVQEWDVDNRGNGNVTLKVPAGALADSTGDG